MTVKAEHAAVIGRFLDALIVRDYGALEAVFADDFIEVTPQSGERIRGASNFLEILRRAPDPPGLLAGPFLTSCRDDLVLAEAKFDYGGKPWWYVDRFELRDGRIRRMTSYFGEPFESPEWRRPFVRLEATIDPTRWADDGDGQPVDRATVDRYLQALIDRDPVARNALLHHEFRGLYPQSGERSDSAGALAEAHGYPGGLPRSRSIETGGGGEDWIMTPLGTPVRVSGEADTWFAEALLEYASGERMFSVIVLAFRAGLVWRERRYFSPPFEPAAWRADLVERYDPLASIG
jgi:hypothetical protein